MNAGVLGCRDLAFWRNDKELFRDIEFSVESGQILRVEGVNGAGKTTLLKLLAGLLHPEEGEITWNGERIEAVSVEYRDSLTYIGHTHGIKPELSALENLDFYQAMLPAPTGVAPRQALQRLGLAGYETTLCRRLSAGQQRRVALARLCFSPACLWILDEPFTSIDREGIDCVERLLAAHVQSGGILVVTSHQSMSFEETALIRLTLGENA